jgi:hypothetical protein
MMNKNSNVLPTSAGVKGCTLNATTATIVTISMADANNSNNLQPGTKQQKNQNRRDMYVMHHERNNRWTSSKLSCLAEPVTPSSVTKEQPQATTTNKTILLVLQK